jgi:hypothetical protein
VKLPNNLDELERIARFSPTWYERACRENEDALRRGFKEFRGAAVDWHDERTGFRPDLVIRGESYKPLHLFELQAHRKPKIPENPALRHSTSDGFHYHHMIYPRGISIDIKLGKRRGHAWFTRDVMIPMLSRDQGGHPTVMSVTPGEIFTLRPGIKRARGCVLVGGLGMGWFLRKVCARPQVQRVIVVEKSEPLLNLVGDRLRAIDADVANKVTDWICGDALNHVGNHVVDQYLLDIWDEYGDHDHRFAKLKREQPVSLWGWGQKNN